MARYVPVPPRVMALGVLDPADYQDAVAASTEVRHPPREWARRIFASASPTARRVVLRIFGLLGLRRAPAPTGQALPGKLIQDGPDEVVIGFDLGIGLTARVIVTNPPGQIVMTTLVRTTSPRARAAWAALAPVHRRLARGMVDRATADAGTPPIPEPGLPDPESV